MSKYDMKFIIGLVIFGWISTAVLLFSENAKHIKTLEHCEVVE